ncbi:MAG: hypothetical protein FWC65_02000 [Treponema sp.]|nr:hypothetical protein [Treponema sp.]
MAIHQSTETEPKPPSAAAQGEASAHRGDLLQRANLFLDKVFPILLSLGVVLGVMFPLVFIELRPLVPWLFGTVTLAGALKLRVRELGRAVASPLPIILFFFMARFFMPTVIFLLSSLIFRGEPDIVAGYVVLYSVPAAVTAFIWVSIFKGDPALALTLILLDTLLSPIVVPATVRFFLGAGIDLDMMAMAISLILMIVIPTIAGVTINEASRGKIPAVITPYLAPLTRLIMLLVLAANTAAVAPQIRLDNPRLWTILAACIGFIALSFTCARLVALMGKFDRKKQISFQFATSLRNSVAGMTLAIQHFPELAALPAVMGVVLQQNTAAIMGRLFFGKIGGAPEPKGGEKSLG